MSWRFYPVVGFPTCGLITGANRKPVPAEYLTPEQAKVIALGKKHGKAA